MAARPSSDQGDSLFCLPVMDSNQTTATVYHFSHIDHKLEESLHWNLHDVWGEIVRGAIIVPKLEVAMLDT